MNYDKSITKATFNNQEAVDKFLDREHGYLLNAAGETIGLFELLEDGATYRLTGSYWNIVQSKRDREQADSRIFELEIFRTLQNEFGKGAHLHENYKFTENNKDVAEIDAIVHLGGEGINNSSAYIVECTYTPQLGDIKMVNSKVDIFKKYYLKDQHFKSVNVNNIFPVLAGKKWEPNVIDAVKNAKNILRIGVSGSRFQIYRDFTTLIMKSIK